jgi:selenophosphate synthase
MVTKFLSVKCWRENRNRKSILADPQTSGGLLIAVDPAAVKDVEVGVERT